MKSKLFYYCLFIFSSFCANAQIVTNVCESDPCNALSIYSTTTIGNTRSYVSTGSPISLCNSNFFGNNWVYYRLNVYSVGTLQFSINPYDPLADYNYALWDITNTGCSSLTSVVSCNASVSAGSVNSGSIPVQTGQTYILGIQRNSGGLVSSGVGYVINFSGTTASLTDNTPPFLSSVLPFNTCNPVTQIKVKLSERVSCFQTGINDFLISGIPNSPFANAAFGQNCNGCVHNSYPSINYSNYSDTVIINFANALPPGNYTIGFNPASTNLPRNFGNLLPNSSITVSFEVPNSLDINHTPNYDCNTGTFTETVQGIGGQPPYQYKVKGGVFSNVYSNPTPTSESFTNFQGGITYTLYVKDANGCEDSVLTTNNAVIPLQDFNLNSSTSPLCHNNFAQAAIVISPINSGQPPYQFSIASDPVSALQSAISNSNGTWTNLIFPNQATFTVTVTDALGCTKTGIQSLTNPSPLSVQVTNFTNPSCPNESNGAIAALASGGTSPYAYSFNPSLVPPMVFGNSSPIHLGNMATNMMSSNYTILATDANGCYAQTSIPLLAPNLNATNLQVEINNGINSQIVWNGDAPWYEIRYKTLTASVWNPIVTSNASNKWLFGLTPNTTYTAEVRGKCGATGNGAWIGITFTTTNNCTVPTGLFVTDITATTSKLNWSMVPGATHYLLRRRPVGSTTWSNSTSMTNQKNIASLLPATNYEFQVAAFCNESSTGYSSALPWTTHLFRPAEELPQVDDFLIYPNPVQQDVTVEFSLPKNEPVFVNVLNLQGEVVYRQQFDMAEGRNQLDISLAELRTGIYFLQFFSESVHVTRMLEKL